MANPNHEEITNLMGNMALQAQRLINIDCDKFTINFQTGGKTYTLVLSPDDSIMIMDVKGD